MLDLDSREKRRREPQRREQGGVAGSIGVLRIEVTGSVSGCRIPKELPVLHRGGLSAGQAAARDFSTSVGRIDSGVLRRPS